MTGKNVDLKNLGSNIKAIRESKNRSQGFVAHKTGLNKSGLSRIESGETENPGIMTLNSIAEALDVPLVELLGEDLLQRALDEQSEMIRLLLANLDILSQTIEDVPGLIGWWAQCSPGAQAVIADLIAVEYWRSRERHESGKVKRLQLPPVMEQWKQVEPRVLGDPPDVYHTEDDDSAALA